MKEKKKQKQVSIQEYIETYCGEKRIRERYAVYISPETHENLKKIVRLFCYEHHTTTSSLADTIISHHIEAHKDILNEEYREHNRKFIDDFNNLGRKEKPESSEDNASDE
jgi:hypothetical protein